MTPEQIEAAARELCRIRGIDPDAPSDTKGYRFQFRPFAMEPAPAPNWRVLALEVQAFVQVGTALAAVAALPEPKPARKTRARA